MKNGKAKGSAFERATAKFLSSWILDNPKAEPIIWRSSNSGGTFTTNRLRGNSKQASMASDLISIDERSKWFMDKFSIECKAGYKQATVFSTFKEAKSNILKGFWEQVNRDASMSNRQPMLIFKPTGCPCILGLDYIFVKQYFPEMVSVKASVTVQFNTVLPKLYLVQADDFFNTYSYNEFFKRLNATI